MAETETEIEVTPEVLRELLDYDPETGVLTWKERDVKWFRDGKRYSAQGYANIWNGKWAGKPAFTAAVSKGYLAGNILSRWHAAHRVAYAIMTGEWPEHCIDHIDGCPSNNRWSNLRAATNSENRQNSRCTSATGYKGVYRASWKEGVFYTGIKENGKTRYIGSGSDPEALARLWDEHAKELHGEFARLNFPDE